MSEVKVTPIVTSATIQKLGIERGGRVHKGITNEIYRVSDPYTPMKTGALKNTVAFDSDGGGFTYLVPYARKHWYDLQGANFRGAPLRGSRWVTRAFNDNQEAIIRSAKEMIKNG